MKKIDKRIILASKSPRRKELMALTPWDFIIDAADVDETMDENSDIEENLKELACRKAEPIAEKYPHDIVRIAGNKVATPAEAREILGL